MNESEARAQVMTAAEQIDLRIDPAFAGSVASKLALLDWHAQQFMSFVEDMPRSVRGRTHEC